MLTAKGYELEPDPIRGELGIAELIVKPFSPRELLQTVERVLSGGRVATAT
jgi:DNA-binding response OmpR family regulator